MNTARIALTPTHAGSTAITLSQDTGLTVRANIVLQTTAGVELLEGAAETHQGVVTLRGRVRTKAQRAKAGLSVASIDGVQGVRNLIDAVDEPEPSPMLVMAPERRKASSAVGPQPTDHVIKSKVEAALSSEKDAKLNGIEVTGVKHGVIHMSGKSASMTGRLRAIELAWRAAAEAASESERRSSEPQPS